MLPATGSLCGCKTEPSAHTILADSGESLFSARRYEDSPLVTASENCNPRIGSDQGT